MGKYNVLKLSHEDLIRYTSNFCESNFLGRVQFGKLYIGERKWLFNRRKFFLVKIWEVPRRYNYNDGDNELRLMDEIVLFRHEKLISHPGLMRMYGYCLEGEHIGAVYKVKPFDTVYNLIPKDGFTWLQRIKVALGLASLLKFLHSRNSQYKPFVVRNLDAAHIVLDEDYNPKLCDFGLVTGGIFPDRKINHAFGSYTGVSTSQGHCSDKLDVFAFGFIVLSLIAKKGFTEEDRQASAPWVDKWARREYKGTDPDGYMMIPEPKHSLVHHSLTADPDFCAVDEHEITSLVYQCVKELETERPSMKQVLKSLLKLQVVKKHTDFMGVNKLVRPE